MVELKGGEIYANEKKFLYILDVYRIRREPYYECRRD